MNLHRPNRLRLSALGPVSGWQRDRFFLLQGDKSDGIVRRGGAEEGAPPDLASPPSRPLVAGAGVAARRPEAGSGGDRSAAPKVGKRRARCCSAMPVGEEGQLLLRPGLTSSSLRSTGSDRRWGGDGRHRRWGRWVAPEVGERTTPVGSSVGLRLGEAPRRGQTSRRRAGPRR
jgi:hypothetical protein